MKVVLIFVLLVVLAGEYLYVGSHKQQPTVKKAQTVFRSATPTVIPENLKTVENILYFIQEYRTKNGKAPYIHSEFLCSIAETRLKETILDYSHNGFHYSRFCDNCYIGENLSKGGQYADDTYNGWIASPPHKKILDMNYTHTCMKTNGENVVQIFGYY